MRYPKSIQSLINELIKLPTVGPKTAERYVFHLLKQSPEELQKLAQYIAELKEKTLRCSNCLTISETNPCEICSDTKRDTSLLCIVSNSRDMHTIEATKQYNGKYHILGGLINTIDGIKPDDLNIKQLITRLKQGGIQEIILALSPTIEGETTSLYLNKLLSPSKIKLTKLARGLSTGSDLEYADDLTLTNALKFRNEMKSAT